MGPRLAGLRARVHTDVTPANGDRRYSRRCQEATARNATKIEMGMV